MTGCYLKGSEKVSWDKRGALIGGSHPRPYLSSTCGWTDDRSHMRCCLPLDWVSALKLHCQWTVRHAQVAVGLYSYRALCNFPLWWTDLGMETVTQIRLNYRVYVNKMTNTWLPLCKEKNTSLYPVSSDEREISRWSSLKSASSLPKLSTALNVINKQ